MAINMSEEDQATDTGNTHKKFGKDRACGSGDILVDRRTYSSQYFGIAPAGKEISTNSVTNKNTVTAIAPRHKVNSFSYRHYKNY